MIVSVASSMQAGCKTIDELILVAAPEGFRRQEEIHADLDIYVAGTDGKFN